MNCNDQIIPTHIRINIATQTLSLFELPNLDNEADDLLMRSSLQPSISFDVSTAKNGIGNLESTGCTPLGKHTIAEKIGHDCSLNTVFVGRVATGEIYNDQLGGLNPDRDWILTRILWLRGLEEGINKGQNDKGCCDTYQRYIYIHGTPDTEPMGVPLSHGCIRMRNKDIVNLFARVSVGTTVDIVAT